MLKEFHQVKQHPDEPRRWFCGDSIELTLWMNKSGNFTGFQFELLHKTPRIVATWQKNTPHLRIQEINSGSAPPFSTLTYKGSPTLSHEEVTIDSLKEEIAKYYRVEKSTLPGEIQNFIETSGTLFSPPN